MLIPILIGAGIVAALVIFFCSIYKVADIDKALIITGGKEPIIKVSGGSFVIPIFRKAQYFDLCMLTVKASRDEIRTVTSVPIVTDWTAQIRPDVSNMENLKKAIMSFKERGSEGIITDVQLTLMGAVRDIVASMTPEAVLRDKAEFAQKVRDTVEDEMRNMGMELVSLNIQDISDNNGYYDNIATLDTEDKRLHAENKRADADRDIRKKQAVAEQEAADAELTSQLTVAAKQRDNALKLAEFKAETDKAQADAAVAGELQRTIRSQEVAAQQGRVAVIQQEQANLAAVKERDVIVTKAQAEKDKALIQAEGNANVKRIEADAGVEVATRDAKAMTIAAEASAAKAIKEGQAKAEVIKQQGMADAEAIRQRGLAEAEIARERGLAEAEAEKARLLAQAEGERELAAARASNERVNFEIEKIKIETEARIAIATKTAEVMASIGKNAEFVNIGGNGNSPTGNVLTDTLCSIPGMMKMLNAENQALNGQPINDEVRGLMESIFGPVKGLLSSNAVNTPVVETSAVGDSDGSGDVVDAE